MVNEREKNVMGAFNAKYKCQNPDENEQRMLLKDTISKIISFSLTFDKSHTNIFTIRMFGLVFYFIFPIDF